MSQADPPDIWAAFQAAAPPAWEAAFRAAGLEALRLSGLFDADCYQAHRGAVPGGVDPLEDYHDRGWRAGHWPNPYFDPGWYATQYPDVAAAGTDPLLHYVSYGEPEGRRPVAWFDPAWYRMHHAVPAGMHALAHYLRHRTGGVVRPIPEFDSAWYVRTNPDVAAAGIDPMEHYRVQGFREGRDPSADFDTRYYRVQFLRGQPDENPLLHYLRHRGTPGIHPRQPPGLVTTADEVRRFTAAGPDFEAVAPLTADAVLRALVLAFYLPQFHPIPQNDAWWGAGFTEWTNLPRGLPRFAGHYQPRIPRDLGHYRLDDPATLRRQAALARGAGIGGLVFYFYWFGGQRLLEAPLEALLAERDIDLPFCLMWANENWTRRWDGADADLLIAQDYDPAGEAALVACYARYFADPRYIRLQGRPLLMVYRAGLIPEPAAAMDRWRALFRGVHGEDPILVMAQSFGDTDPRDFGFDAAVEFPPHGLVAGLSLINPRLDLLDHGFAAQVYDYRDMAAAAEAAAPVDYPLLRTALPGWDNDARRQGRGMVVQGATPARYQAWLSRLIEGAQAAPVFGAAVVCVNAWNEWAEGAYLEPDVHFGAAFLNATARAVAAPAGAAAAVLLVGHDAFAAGAQLLLLNIARSLRAAHGVRLEIALCGGGALEPQYRAVASVTRLEDAAALATLIARLRRSGVAHAVVNSAAAAWCCPALIAAGIAPLLLVHEMPTLLAERGLIAPLRVALEGGAWPVFAASAVRDVVARTLRLSLADAVIVPQGLYQAVAASPAAEASVRKSWGIADGQRLAVGMGYADRRKGFDLFVRVFRLAAAADPALHMAWVGALDPDLRHELAPEIAQANATGRFHLPGWRDDGAAVLQAADAFLLTSREDGYPSVVLEALAAGTPVIAFAGGGGIPDLLHRCKGGMMVPMEDCAAMAAALVAGLPRAAPLSAPFGPYVAALLDLVWPGRARISVVVTCYNQARFVAARLASVFGQSVPVDTVRLYDDASADGSAAAAQAAAASAGRMLTVVRAARNSGSPFGAWRRAVAESAGDLIWIAEADDNAEPDFLANLAPAFGDPAVVMAVCDSLPVDSDGRPTAERYQDSYAAAGGAGALSADAVYEGPDFVARTLSERNILFNVSAVLWRRKPLLEALERLGNELAAWRVAGDWRLYAEVLLAGGRIAFIAKVLNRHHRDAASASGTVPVAAHLAEIARMHALLGGDAGRQAAYLLQAEAYLRARAQRSAEPEP